MKLWLCRKQENEHHYYYNLENIFYFYTFQDLSLLTSMFVKFCHSQMVLIYIIYKLYLTGILRNISRT